MADRTGVSDWITEYERAWRASHPDLGRIFSDRFTYVASPWAEPIDGTDDLRRFWEASRAPDERFEMRSEIVAVDGDTAVVRVTVDYDDGERWRDLWLITLDADGRCRRFEEWPFAPDQRDGHEDDR